jgi:hypothetical protein
MHRMPESIFQRMLCAIIITLSIPFLVCAQQPDRIVDWHPVRLGSKERVLEIVDIKVDGKSITVGQPFAAGEDWLDTLTFRVRNVSGKTISVLGFGVGFPELGVSGPIPMFSISYGDYTKTNPAARKAFLADEEVDLKLPKDQLEGMRDVSTKTIGTSHLSKLTILPGLVTFEDGSGVGGISLRKPAPEKP